MKKNWTLKAAGILLALTLITSCFVGGTFAKYVTKAEGTDKARVARFGVVVSASDNNTFHTKYKTDDTDIDTSKIEYSVSSSDTANLVAPGTKGDNVFHLGVSGTPEVAVKVSIVFNWSKDVFLKQGNYQDRTKTPYTGNFTLDANYTPVVFTLTKMGEAAPVATGTLDVIKAEIEKLSGDYAPGTNLANEIGTYTLSWAWAFEGNDKADTLLGDLAAMGDNAKTQLWKWDTTDNKFTTFADSDFSTDIEFTFSITVTQID